MVDEKLIEALNQIAAKCGADIEIDLPEIPAPIVNISIPTKGLFLHVTLPICGTLALMTLLLLYFR